MAKKNRSRRFIQQNKTTVSKHDEVFPYQTTYAEAEARKKENIQSSALGGIE